MIVVIDDSIFVQQAWKSHLSDCDVEVQCFSAPKDAREFFAKIDPIPATISGAIIDIFFQKDEENGLSLAKHLRDQKFTMPIFLSSHSVPDASELTPLQPCKHIGKLIADAALQVRKDLQL